MNSGNMESLSIDGLDAIWQDLDWAMGQLFFMGWDGTEITPQIRALIEDYHLGSILLTAKNLKTAEDTAKLVQDLQTIAHEAGHPVPLLIAVDQENGGVNSLFDEDYICQFPSAMGIAATGSPELAYDVAHATAKEISAVGVNMIMGPGLDVLTSSRYQPLGVRASGDDPQEVSQYGLAALSGYKDAGLTACGKHFPSYGNLDFLGSSMNMPIITETIEQLSLSALVPFRNAIREGVDAIMVGGCAMANSSMNVMHACLSNQVVDELLRNDLGFNGVTISECLEMDALSHDIGVRGGTVMAVEAGCDLVLLCRSFPVQQEAISGLKLGVENEMISRERIYLSLRRVLELKSKCTSWEKALNPPGIRLLSTLHAGHLELSTRAYDNSITVIRDQSHLLPLSNTLSDDDELLLLTPLLKPLPASAATNTLNETANLSLTDDKRQQRSSIMSGEGVFRELGRSLARQRNGKLLHTSYTANGVRPVHENLINRASTIILVTADANRNLYQSGFTKHVSMMCSMLSSAGKKKSLIVVSVSSPYDFAMDKSIGTYVCTFDFTETALSALVRALFGEFVPQGTLPGTLRKSKKVVKSRQHWLVETWNPETDLRGLQALIHSVSKATPAGTRHVLEGTHAAAFDLISPLNASDNTFETAHYVVRNSSTHALFGFCATLYHASSSLGIIAAIFVDPSKRNLSIGRSLHQRAIRGLLAHTPKPLQIQLGSGLPSVYLGIPMSDISEGATLKRWFDTKGWEASTQRGLFTLTVRNLAAWDPPEGLLQSVQRYSFSFDLIHGRENADTVLEHVCTHATPEIQRLYDFAIDDEKGCGIVRAKSPVDGSLVGTVIICRSESLLSRYVPLLRHGAQKDNEDGEEEGEEIVGGIVGPVVPGDQQQAHIVLQGLALLGLRQNKAHGAASTVLSWVGPGERDVLLSMGFDVLGAFEELIIDTEDMS